MGLLPWSTSDRQRYILVTGSNSGLGFSICERLIDEFLTSPSRSRAEHLVLIVSTRSSLKTRLAIGRLRQHLRKLAESSVFQRTYTKPDTDYQWADVVNRIHFLGVELDLCDLESVFTAAAKIRGENGGLGSPDLLTSEGMKRNDGKGAGLRNVRVPRLDAIILNAGMGGWTGIKWGAAIWSSLFDTRETMTYWEHNIHALGRTVSGHSSTFPMKSANTHTDEKSTSEQTLSSGQESTPDHVLGEVFTANVFGHYILAHELMPLLQRSPNDERMTGERGRVIWLSSIEASDPSSFGVDDIQGLSTSDPYKSSKRLTDILALTATLPGVRRTSSTFYAIDGDLQADSEAELYIAHPGVIHTGIMPLPTVLQWFMVLAFYLARLLGSVWHPVSAYSGAVAPVWLALSHQSVLDDLETPITTSTSPASQNSTYKSVLSGPNSIEADVTHITARMFPTPATQSSSCEPAGKGKWGSSTDRWGAERVRRTEVPGWGWAGVVETTDTKQPDQNATQVARRLGITRKRGAVDLTREAREDFEVLGQKTWKAMEDLRREWTQRVLGQRKRMSVGVS